MRLSILSVFCAILVLLSANLTYAQTSPGTALQGGAGTIYAGAGNATPWAQNDHGMVRLIATSPTVGEDPQIQLGLHFKMEPGWHIYWRSAGDAGYPPKVDWTGSQNIKSAQFLWPAPIRVSIGDIQTIGYGEEVVLPITADLIQPGQPVQIHASVDYLTCNQICVPYKYVFALNLQQGMSLITEETSLIKMFVSKLPDKDSIKSLMAINNVFVSGDQKPVFEIHAIKADGFAKPDIFIESDKNISFGPPEFKIDTDKRKAIITVAVNADDPALLKNLTQIPFTFTMVDGEVAHEATMMPVVGGGNFTWQKVLLMVAFGILGGLILNVMPCVLPVLSIKLMQIIAKHDFERHWVRKGFMATAAGIIVSFLALAGILTALKLTGQQIGWGIQFQQPLFLIFLAIIVFIFAANMWGIFEIRLPQFIANIGRLGNDPQGHSLSKEFLMGAFATLLATPCSAPFLGTALGFALSQGIGEIFIIFTAIGLGMALPYFIVAVYPHAVYALPKPGRWMLAVRRVLAVFLLVTGLWLVSIVVVQTTNVMDPPASKQTLPWQAFDPRQIGTLVSQNKIVVVDVTADWCLTCKVNERLVLQSQKIQSLLTQPNVVLMRGDWTKPNDSIAKYLAGFGRYGIPFNAVYSAKFPTGKPLPELLSESAVERAMTEAR
ncbi:MAG: disulfide bond formation protein DsbD [Alphaproteobacteria bacterium]|nr:MAG: disulfide bond formation protein DsbD [Alphaproteobacteria bacterium]